MSYPKFWTQSNLSKLRKLYQSGLSMRDVGQIFGKSEWSIRSIMIRKNLSRRIASDTRNIQFRKSHRSFNPKTNLSQKERQLKIAGLMLYWGEGGKKNIKGIDFANSDPDMIKIFLLFLRRIYRIDETRLRLYLYSYQSLPTHILLKYWSDLTNIPINQFSKPYIRSQSNGIHDKMQHGLAHIRYSDLRLLNLVVSEIKEFITRWDGRVDKYTTL